MAWRDPNQRGGTYRPRAKTNRRKHTTLTIILHSLSHSRSVYGGGVIKIEPLIVEYTYCTGLGRDGVTAVSLVGCIDILGSTGME